MLNTEESLVGWNLRLRNGELLRDSCINLLGHPFARSAEGIAFNFIDVTMDGNLIGVFTYQSN